MTTIESSPSPANPALAGNPPQPYPAGRWTLKTLRSPFYPKGSGNSRPAPVQGELSLDTIRPVRNDLSDSDLEIVPARRAASKPAKPPAAPPAAMPGDALARAAMPWWRRLGARLLKRA
jgi:hypothetical protein